MTTNTEFKGYRGRGLPGSVHCRLNFEIDGQAFTNVKLPTEVKKRREEIVQFKKRSQLGEKPSWNNSVGRKWTKPAIMRQLSKYQSIKIPYSYRDMEISEVYKNQIFIPKSGKYEIDPYPFLDEKQKKLATRKNILVHREREKEKKRIRRKNNHVSTEDFNLSTFQKQSDVTKGSVEVTQKAKRATKQKGNRIFRRKKRASLVRRYKGTLRSQRRKKLETRRFDEMQASLRGNKKVKERPRFITRV